jgi:hypothetical protein
MSIIIALYGRVLISQFTFHVLKGIGCVSACIIPKCTASAVVVKSCTGDMVVVNLVFV